MRSLWHSLYFVVFGVSILRSAVSFALAASLGGHKHQGAHSQQGSVGGEKAQKFYSGNNRKGGPKTALDAPTKLNVLDVNREEFYSGNERDYSAVTATFHADAALPTPFGNFRIRSYRLVGVVRDAATVRTLPCRSFARCSPKPVVAAPHAPPVVCLENAGELQPEADVPSV